VSITKLSLTNMPYAYMPNMILIFLINNQFQIEDDKRFEVGLNKLNPFQLLIE